MSNEIEIICNAPPYSIVCASKEAGMDVPEDVRWERYQDYQSTGCCVCHVLLVLPRAFLFSFKSGDVVVLGLGQCPRCKTIFWSEHPR